MTSETENQSSGFRVPGGRMVAVLVLLLLCLGGAIGGLTLALGTDKLRAALTGAAGGGEPAMTEGKDQGAAAPEAGKDAETTRPANEMAVTPFREIIVNINATTATGRTTSRFMKLNIALVFDDQVEGAERIEERRLFLRDSFQDYLRQLTERDLQGTLGLITIKQELLRRARVITESDAPHEILIADLIVQ